MFLALDTTPAILGTLSALFTAVLGWMGEIVTTMTTAGNELLLIGVGFFVVGGAIGLAKRIIG